MSPKDAHNADSELETAETAVLSENITEAYQPEVTVETVDSDTVENSVEDVETTENVENPVETGETEQVVENSVESVETTEDVENTVENVETETVAEPAKTADKKLVIINMDCGDSAREYDCVEYTDDTTAKADYILAQRKGGNKNSQALSAETGIEIISIAELEALING